MADAGQPGVEVAMVAHRWWLTKRPLSFGEKEHLANPTVNCVTLEEQLLAKAVAAWVEQSGATDMRNGR